jgi:hypothetical protein
MNPRIPSKERRKIALPQLKSKFEATLLEIAAAFKKTDGFQHAQTKGNEREAPIRKFLEDHLPCSYAAVGGEIVDVEGNISPQIDVIVYNKMKNPAFLSGHSYILPAEAPLVTFEVKSKLTKEEIRKSLKAAAKLKALKPLGRELRSTARKNGQARTEDFRYFHCLFAYSTDLVESADWERNEYTRLKEAAAEEKIQLDLFDRIYVADRGMIMPRREAAIREQTGSAVALFQLFLHLMNFIQREEPFRPPTDYTNYSGNKGITFINLKDV